MKTAVEWLYDQIENEGKCIYEVMEQAKEMEKEQMKIYQIDKELFKRLPIEGVNCTSFNVNEHRYFATKYYIDNFKENYKNTEQ
jgi:hypothetical protein